MKKALRIYGWTWVIVVASSLITAFVWLIYTSHHDLAKDPNNLARIVKVDLPSIAESKSEDNLNRGASRWDMYIHHGRFSEELSEETTKGLDELCVTDSLHWSKDVDSGCYLYYDDGGIDELYFVLCSIYKDRFVITYKVDELEGILLYWGLVLVIILIIKRFIKR